MLPSRPVVCFSGQRGSNEEPEALRSVYISPLPSARLFPSLPQPSSHQEEGRSIFSGTVTSLTFP